MDITHLRSKRRCTLYPTNALPKNSNFEVIKHFNPKNYGTSNGSELPEVGLEEDDEREFIKTDEQFRPGRPNKSSNAAKKNARIKSFENSKPQNVSSGKTNPPTKESNSKVKPTPPNRITKKQRQQPCPIYKYNTMNSKNVKGYLRDSSLDSSSSDQNNDPKPNRPIRRCCNSKAKKVVDTTLDSVRNKKELQNCVKSTLKQLGTTKIDIKMNTTHNRIFAQKSDAVQCNPRNEAYLICASYVQQLKDEIKTAKSDSKGQIYETANQLKNEIADYVQSKDQHGKIRVVTKANAEVKVIFKKNRGCNVESSDMEPSQHEMKNAATSISWCEYCALSKRYHEMQMTRENVLNEDIRNYDEKFICTHSFEQCGNWGFTDKVPSLDKTFTKEVPVQDNLNDVTNECGNASCCLNENDSNLRMDEILADKDFEKPPSLYTNESTFNTIAIENNQSATMSLRPRLTREKENMNLQDLQLVDNGSAKEASDTSSAFSNLLDKAEELMQNLAIQISNYSSYQSKSPKAICMDRGTSPVAVTKRSAKVLCKPYGKSVGCMPMSHEDKVNVSIQVTDDSFQVNVVSQGTSFNVLDMEEAKSLNEFDDDKPLKLNTENVAVQTEDVVVENENVPIENEIVTVENEPVDEIISEPKTKLTVQQMPCINIPRKLVMQKVPDIVITSTESLPEAEMIQDNNIGYVIVKHHSTEKITKPTSKNAYPCGCTNRSKKEVLDTNNASLTNTNASNLPTIPSILKSMPTSSYDKARVSIGGSVVSFNYDNKTFENATSNGDTNNDVEYFNSVFKTDDSAIDVVVSPPADDNDEDVFERSSRLSTYIELGKADKVLIKEYVKGVIKDPKTEIMFKSFQLINDKIDIDVEEGSEVDISSVDVNFYKTFVNPNGPKNVDLESNIVSAASSRSKVKQQVQPSENIKPIERELSNETFLPINEFQRFITSNDTSKPSDSDFSEILNGLPKNTARNSYNNDKVPLEGEDDIDLQQIEEDPILKVRELYQEAVRTSKKSGQFVSSHFMDVTIPPEIQDKFHSGRSSLRQTEIDFKGIEPFAKPPPEKAAPRMIDINLNNFMNTMPDNASIYSDTTEDVILEIDTEQLREAQVQNLNNTFPRGSSGAWNDIDMDDSEFVVTHDVSLQTSLEDISEELATTELNTTENRNKSLDQIAVLPSISYTSQNKDDTSQFNLINGEDNGNETVQRKSVKIEEPSNPIQNKTAQEMDEEESIMTFISQLTNSDAMKDVVLAKNFTPSNTQGVFSKYQVPENAVTLEMSTQTSTSQMELPENITNEGQTQTDIWHAAIINPPVLPDLSKIQTQPRIIRDKKRNHRNDDGKNGQNSANNSERSDSSRSNPQNRNNGYPSDASASKPIHTIHTNFNKTWESTSNSEPLTISEKSDGEISCKCSASIGEIHNCSTKNTPRHLRKYPQDLIVREFEKENMKIRRRKAHNRNWISYYVSKSNSPEILDESSDSIGLVRKNN